MARNDIRRLSTCNKADAYTLTSYPLISLKKQIAEYHTSKTKEKKDAEKSIYIKKEKIYIKKEKISIYILINKYIYIIDIILLLNILY